MTQHYFITGTDTGIGKTYATCALIQQVQQQGKRAIGIKPILSGSGPSATDWQDSDTMALAQFNSVKLPDAMLTPFLFPLPTSPHIAAAKEDKKLSVADVVAACQPALQQSVDIAFIEGIGGWLVPLNDTETVADLAAAFNFPVILVVGLRLGCLNHALLTAEAIKAKGLMLQGWLANQIDPEFTFTEEYLTSLRSRISAPLLGYIPYKTFSIRDYLGGLETQSIY